MLGLDGDEKVVLEPDVADDGEEVDQDEGQDGREDDGPAVPRDGLDDVEERFLAVDHVQELRTQKTDHFQNQKKAKDLTPISSSKTKYT